MGQYVLKCTNKFRVFVTLKNLKLEKIADRWNESYNISSNAVF